MGERKIRSDKKREVAPYVNEAAYKLVNRISYICDLPIKTVGEMIGREALKSPEIMGLIGERFRRDFRLNEYHVFMGRSENKPFRQKWMEEKQRLHMKYYSFEYDRFSELAFSLDCSVSAAAGLLIQTSIQQKHILYPILSRGIIRQLDPKRIQQLRELCRYLDAYSSDHYITIPLVISEALTVGLQQAKKINKTFEEWNESFNKPNPPD